MLASACPGQYALLPCSGEFGKLCMIHQTKLLLPGWIYLFTKHFLAKTSTKLFHCMATTGFTFLLFEKSTYYVIIIICRMDMLC